MWDRSLATLAKCRNLKFVKDKFQGSPDIVKGLYGNSTDTFPIIFCWISLKGGGLDLLSCLIKQEIYIGDLFGSLVLALPATLCCLLF